MNDSMCDPPFKTGFELCVLPGHVMLARLNDNFLLTDCSKVLVRTVPIVAVPLSPPTLK